MLVARFRDPRQRAAAMLSAAVFVAVAQLAWSVVVRVSVVMPAVADVTVRLPM